MTELTLKQKIDSFIAYKHNLGYVYDTHEGYLRNYLKHIEELFPHLNTPDKESTDSFLDKYKSQSGGLYNAMASLREFSRYLMQIGYTNVYQIPPKQMPKLHPEPPYFFSGEEISAFFRSCDVFCEEHHGPLGRGLVLAAEFRLLYCCGLRPKEARLLLWKDVHLSARYIDITQSKGPKNRRIFISDELVSYLAGYDASISRLFPERKYFFPRTIEKAYSRAFLGYDFELIWKRAFPNWEGKLPRIYDFRHHFAWANINRWARERTDINSMLPYLMRYMGHSSVKHTLYYFRFVPDFYSDYEKLVQKLNDRIPEVSDG